MATKEYEVCDDIKWIDVLNPSQAEMQELSDQYQLNNDIVQDCMQPQHLPKYELVDDVHFLILRFFAKDPDKPIATIQELTNKIAIFYTEKFIITIHKSEAAFLEEVRKRYLDKKKCDSVSDILVKIIWNDLESFDDPVTKLSEKLDSYESEVMLKKISPDLTQELYIIKHEASVSHKVLMLMQEPINHVQPEKGNTSTVQDMKDQYLKMLTLYSQVLDDVTNLMNLYMSLSAKRTNEVMRVLTVFSVFFMPLTFIVGVYGMNFKFMPELNWRLGYPIVMIFMAIVTIIIYFWFKRKKWL
jgi:magnesium transporter